VPPPQAAESTALSHDTPPHDGPSASPGPSSTGEFAERQRIGRYELLLLIGVGAMGVVFAAYDGVLDHQVAIKLVRSDRADPNSQARIVREGRALARLAHPNVVACRRRRRRPRKTSARRRGGGCSVAAASPSGSGSACSRSGSASP